MTRGSTIIFARLTLPHIRALSITKCILIKILCCLIDLQRRRNSTFQVEVKNAVLISGVFSFHDGTNTLQCAVVIKLTEFPKHNVIKGPTIRSPNGTGHLSQTPRNFSSFAFEIRRETNAFTRINIKYEDEPYFKSRKLRNFGKKGKYFWESSRLMGRKPKMSVRFLDLHLIILK